MGLSGRDGVGLSAYECIGLSSMSVEVSLSGGRFSTLSSDWLDVSLQCSKFRPFCRRLPIQSASDRFS